MTAVNTAVNVHVVEGLFERFSRSYSSTVTRMFMTIPPLSLFCFLSFFLKQDETNSIILFSVMSGISHITGSVLMKIWIKLTGMVFVQKKMHMIQQELTYLKKSDVSNEFISQFKEDSIKEKEVISKRSEELTAELDTRFLWNILTKNNGNNLSTLQDESCNKAEKFMKLNMHEHESLSKFLNKQKCLDFIYCHSLCSSVAMINTAESYTKYEFPSYLKSKLQGRSEEHMDMVFNKIDETLFKMISDNRDIILKVLNDTETALKSFGASVDARETGDPIIKSEFEINRLAYLPILFDLMIFTVLVLFQNLRLSEVSLVSACSASLLLNVLVLSCIVKADRRKTKMEQLLEEICDKDSVEALLTENHNCATEMMKRVVETEKEDMEKTQMLMNDIQNRHNFEVVLMQVEMFDTRMKKICSDVSKKKRNMCINDFSRRFVQETNNTRYGNAPLDSRDDLTIEDFRDFSEIDDQMASDGKEFVMIIDKFDSNG